MLHVKHAECARALILNLKKNLSLVTEPQDSTMPTLLLFTGHLLSILTTYKIPILVIKKI
jgi:hypothetical protein